MMDEQDPLDDRAKRSLLDELAGKTGNTGFNGGAPPSAIDAAPAAAPMADLPTAPKADYSSRMAGFDAAKMADTAHASPKYQVGRALSQFDPSKGYTPEVLDSLNKLGVGTFSSDGGDRLSVKSDDPRWNGMNSWDGIYSFKDPANAQWSFGVDSNLDTAPPTAAGAIGGGMMGGGGGLNSMLQGNAQNSIQQALASVQKPGLLQQLLESLRQGGA